MLRYGFINPHYEFKLFFHASVSFSPKLQACHGHWPEETLCQLMCFILALKIWPPRAILISKPSHHLVGSSPDSVLGFMQHRIVTHAVPS